MAGPSVSDFFPSESREDVLAKRASTKGQNLLNQFNKAKQDDLKNLGGGDLAEGIRIMRERAQKFEDLAAISAHMDLASKAALAGNSKLANEMTGVVSPMIEQITGQKFDMHFTGSTLVQSGFLDGTYNINGKSETFDGSKYISLFSQDGGDTYSTRTSGLPANVKAAQAGARQARFNLIGKYVDASLAAIGAREKAVYTQYSELIASGDAYDWRGNKTPEMQELESQLLAIDGVRDGKIFGLAAALELPQVEFSAFKNEATDARQIPWIDTSKLDSHQKANASKIRNEMAEEAGFVYSVNKNQVEYTLADWKVKEQMKEGNMSREQVISSVKSAAEKRFPGKEVKVTAPVRARRADR